MSVLNRCKDGEAKELLSDLPIEKPFYAQRGQTLWDQINGMWPNAKVVVSAEGLSIFLNGGGALFVDLEHVKGDLGPFAE